MFNRLMGTISRWFTKPRRLALVPQKAPAKSLILALENHDGTPNGTSETDPQHSMGREAVPALIAAVVTNPELLAPPPAPDIEVLQDEPHLEVITHIPGLEIESWDTKSDGDLQDMPEAGQAPEKLFPDVTYPETDFDASAIPLPVAAFRNASPEVTRGVSRVLHEFVSYQEDGKFVLAHYSRLQDPDFFYEMEKRKDLRTADNLFPLRPRLGSGRVSHFFIPGKREQKCLWEPEDDDFHNARIESLWRPLMPGGKFTIRVNISGEEWGKSFKFLGNTPGYHWGKNEALHLGKGYIRPDIAGRSKTEPCSKDNPAVFIEVINTHFPSEETWQAYKAYTKQVSSIVLFDSPAEAQPNWSCSINRQTRIIRAVYYIMEGELWRNDIMLPEYTAKRFQHRMLSDRNRQNAGGFIDAPTPRIPYNGRRRRFNPKPPV